MKLELNKSTAIVALLALSVGVAVVNVPGIGDATLEKLRPHVCVGR
jgi:hypothetical protein